MKGLLVFVYRHPGPDCTRNGLSYQKKDLLLVGQPGKSTVEGPFEVHPGEDYLVLIKEPFRIYAVPASILAADEWPMFGGNFVYSSDTRFRELNNGNPIKVFDRVEREYLFRPFD